MNDDLSDNELIRELEHWGNKVCSLIPFVARDIHLRVTESRRTRSLHLALASCILIATAIGSMAWPTGIQGRNNFERKLAVETGTSEPNSSEILKSLLQQSQAIEQRVKNLEFITEQQRQSAREFDELNAQLLKYKRIAIRNQIAINQIP